MNIKHKDKLTSEGKEGITKWQL